MQINADLSNVTPDSFELLPPGEYLARVTDSEVTYSKAGNQIAKFTLTIESGPFAGRKIWDQIIIQGTALKAVEIGLKKLKSMAVALGHPNPNLVQDTEEFHGMAAVIKLKTKPGENGYEDQNQVSRYKPASGPNISLSIPAVKPPSKDEVEDHSMFSKPIIPLQTVAIPAAPTADQDVLPF